MKLINWVVSLFIFCGFCGSVAADETRIFAAASLVDVLAELASAFEDETGREIVVVSGASSIMAQQILAGAPADGFVSAHKGYAERVAAHLDGEVIDLFGNRLVLIAAQDFSGEVDLSDLGAMLENGRLAMGDPTHVPAGIYAQQVLENLGIWADLQNRLAPANDVRSAVKFVQTGAAPFGLVYKTDAALNGVKIVAEIDENLHDEIRYWGVQTNKDKVSAELFFTFIYSFKGQVLVDYFGFQSITSLEETDLVEN